MKWFVQIILDQAATDDQGEQFARIGLSALCNRETNTTEVRIYPEADTLDAAVITALAAVAQVSTATGFKLLAELVDEVSTAAGCTAADPALCCLPGAWARIGALGEHGFRAHGEPLPEAVINTAADRGVEPHALNWHVEAVHGWEPHDAGYDDHVVAAAECLAAGGCEPAT